MDASPASQFPFVPTHGGRYLKYDIFGTTFEVTANSLMNSETGEMVAIKKIANAFDNHIDAKRTLREIKLLRHLDHENVIAIRDVIPPPVREPFNDVYISTELMDSDLHQIIRSNQELTEDHCQARKMGGAVVAVLPLPDPPGLKYIHSARVIHRDLKPSNLLLNANCELKICDFGLARPTAENDIMTEYVVTRWYRAPELLLNSTDYTAAIDVWSVGCIFMELLNRRPLFAGRDHMHQMCLVTQVLGTPTEAELGFVQSEEARRYIRHLSQHPRRPFAELFPHLSPYAIDLAERMLTFDPNRRISVEEALEHPYLARLHDEEDEPICTEPFSFDFEQHVLTEEQMKELIYNESLELNQDAAQ
ncbi:unnamed protein product [Spirodela intermedia]|uniref:Protein kinase domain-containing protein n=1 Tax=Spirodela intermedia TaxID=51605 RepID=A0A7I8IH91_SPIIN|nr:unnamed protein product [Spirodela intermedia]CAA6656867.1 unnamed protein product [Spirodela intermedia]